MARDAARSLARLEQRLDAVDRDHGDWHAATVLDLLMRDIAPETGPPLTAIERRALNAYQRYVARNRERWDADPYVVRLRAEVAAQFDELADEYHATQPHTEGEPT